MNDPKPIETSKKIKINQSFFSITFGGHKKNRNNFRNLYVCSREWGYKMCNYLHSFIKRMLCIATIRIKRRSRHFESAATKKIDFQGKFQLCKKSRNESLEADLNPMQKIGLQSWDICLKEFFGSASLKRIKGDNIHSGFPLVPTRWHFMWQISHISISVWPYLTPANPLMVWKSK